MFARSMTFHSLWVAMMAALMKNQPTNSKLAPLGRKEGCNEYDVHRRLSHYSAIFAYFSVGSSALDYSPHPGSTYSSELTHVTHVSPACETTLHALSTCTSLQPYIAHVHQQTEVGIDPSAELEDGRLARTYTAESDSLGGNDDDW